MAIQTIRTDDLDGTPDASSVSFSLQGESYTIDLAPANLKALKEALAPFIKKASKGTAKASGAGTRPGILAWAKAEGLVPPTHRGKLSKEVTEAYDQAH